MVVAPLLILLALISSDGVAESESATALIARLGSPRFSDRESASEALIELGREALTHLRAARRSADPEVQNRIEGVIDRIERSQLHAATLVELGATEPARPVGQLIREIEKKTGFEIQIEPGHERDWLERATALRGTQPTPFWDALEQLGLDGTWVLDRDPGAFRARALPVFSVTHRNNAVASSIEGPFRFAYRDLRVVPRAQTQQRVFTPGRATTVKPARGMIELQFELVCEPRLLVRPSGQARLVEALDENGQSLLPTGSDAPISSAEGYGLHEPALALTAMLDLPARLDGKIAKIRGVVPVDVEARRLEPIEIPLETGAAATSQAPVWCGDVTFLGARVTDSFSGTPVVEVVVQPEGWSQISLMMFRRRFRGGNNFQEQLTEAVERVVSNIAVVDADGRAIPHGEARPLRPMPDGLHVMLPLAPRPGSGAPALIHYHGTLRDTLNLEFEFKAIPLSEAVPGR